MKKILTVLFCLSLTVLAGSLTACHIHVFREWEVVEFANPGVKGEETRSCRCGYVQTREIAPVPGSVGLIYILNEDGESYMVSGVGSCTDTELVIPATYNGKPVTTIGEGAFERCTNLTSVMIPDSVTSIGAKAFYNCTRLTITVDVNNTAYQSIDGNLYTKDGKTLVQYAIGKTDTSFTIPSSVTSIGDWAFSGCKNLRSVVIPNSVTSIGDYAFSGCTHLTSVVIPNSVTSIGNYAFDGCKILTSVVIGGGLTSIGSNAFSKCECLSRVYYGGTEEDWGNITIGNYSTELTKATRYYYSETKPTTSGNYWYYNEYGNIVIW